MTENFINSALYRKSPLYQLFTSFLIILVTGILLFMIFLLAGILIFRVDLELLQDPSSAVGDKELAFLRYILISQDIALFIVPSLIVLRKLKPYGQIGMAGFKMPEKKEIILVIILAFCIIPLTGFTGQLNSGMELPDWLSGVEKWMTEKEDEATMLFDMILAQDTPGLLILNIIMIAVLPAIGEELIFRRVFQKLLTDLFKSGHIAIWFTAIIFSAIHFQFYGFVPRLILGLIFGYLFLWSGTLWLPVIAHFVNNAIPTIGAYFQGVEAISAPSDLPIWKQMIWLPVPVIIGITILYYFREKYKSETGGKTDQSRLTIE